MTAPELSRGDVLVEPKRYRTLVVDPPWSYRVSSLPPSSKAANGRRSRAAAENYNTLSISQIEAIPLGTWAEDNAHLYVWTTNAFMEEAHRLCRTWGFEQKTIITWIKPNIGMGHHYRNTTEHILFAVRGKLATARSDVRTDFSAPRGSHSEKPAAFYDMVESMSPGPYLDVFARKQRFGWDCFGNEVYTPRWLIETLTSEQAAGLTQA